MSGRKTESPVWSYFAYDASTDKSRCSVATNNDDDGPTHTCGVLLNGKNVTNLRNHLRYKHKREHDELMTLERKRTEQKEERTWRQSQLNVKVCSTY